MGMHSARKGAGEVCDPGKELIENYTLSVLWLGCGRWASDFHASLSFFLGVRICVKAYPHRYLYEEHEESASVERNAAQEEQGAF